MIDFSDKTQLISFIAILAAIAVLLTLTIIVAVRMRKRLSGVAFALGMTLAIIVLILSIGACLTSIAYKTEFMRVDSAIEGNALAFQYDGKTVFSIPYLGIFFEVVFDRAGIEMLLYAATLVDLALLVFLCIRWSLTRNVYNLGEDGEGYYTVGDDEPGAFAASDEPEGETEPESETESKPLPETAAKTPEIPETTAEASEKPIFAAPAPIEETASETPEKIAEEKAADTADKPEEIADEAAADTEIKEEKAAEPAPSTAKSEVAAAPAVNKAALIEDVMRRIASARPAAEELERVANVDETTERLGYGTSVEIADGYKPESVEDILSRITAQPAGSEPGAPVVVKPIKPAAPASEKKTKPATRKIVVPVKSASEVLTKGDKPAVSAPDAPGEVIVAEEIPAPENTEEPEIEPATEAAQPEITAAPETPAPTDPEKAEEVAEEPEKTAEPEKVTEPEVIAEPEEEVKPETEEKTEDRAARFMAPIVAADKAKPAPAKPIKKNGRAAVKSRAAAMFDEYLTGRSAEEREKLLGSIDVITKKND